MTMINIAKEFIIFPSMKLFSKVMENLYSRVSKDFDTRSRLTGLLTKRMA